MTRPEDGIGLVGTVGHRDAAAALRSLCRHGSYWTGRDGRRHCLTCDDVSGPGTEIIEYCAHDLSLTGAEGSVRDLRARGRDWPILWTCDSCGATVVNTGEGWKRYEPVDLHWEIIP